MIKDTIISDRVNNAEFNVYIEIEDRKLFVFDKDDHMRIMTAIPLSLFKYISPMVEEYNRSLVEEKSWKERLSEPHPELYGEVK